MTSKDGGRDPSDKPSFVIAVNPDTVIDPEAIRRVALDHTAAATGSEDLFPQRGQKGPCRICGVEGKMTEEHLPPRAAQYRRRMQGIDVRDWFEKEDLEIPAEGQVIQGGISGYMLCATCNNTAGRYAREYQEWARGAAQVIRSLGVTPEEIDKQDAFPYVTLTVNDLYPGRLVRSALAMMLSISGSAALAEKYPVLRDLVLGGDPAPLPKPLRVFLVLYAGPQARIIGGPAGQAIFDTKTSAVTRMLEVAYPPLAFQMILEGDSSRASGVEISSFSEIAVEDPEDFQIEDLMIGFGHTPYPGDYRTKAKIEAESAANE